MLLNTRGSTLGKERARLSENKGEKRKCKTFSKKIQEKRFLFQRFVTIIVASLGEMSVKKKENFFSASSPLLFKAALPCPPKPLST